MKTILLSYELGSGLSHLVQLIEIAQILKTRHNLVFALRSNAEARQAEDALRTKIRRVQGVTWRAIDDKNAMDATSYTLADPLQLLGFADQKRLAAAVGHWRSVVDQVHPDLIVADFAPSLRLATHQRVPMVVAGIGYAIPPKGRVLPPIRPWQASVKPLNRAAEAEIVLTSNWVAAATGGAAVDYLSDLFNGEANFVCTLPMFDPYRAYRSIDPLWPINVPKHFVNIAGQSNEIPGVFVYLDGKHPGMRALVRALNTIKVPTSLYVTGIDPMKLATVCGKHIAIYKKPIDYSRFLPGLRLLVHHGGLGTCHAALAAGVPQLIIPDRLERILNAQALCTAQVARALSIKQMAEPDRVVRAIQSAMEIQAGLNGKNIDRRSFEIAISQDTLGIVTDRIESLLKAS